MTSEPTIATFRPNRWVAGLLILACVAFVILWRTTAADPVGHLLYGVAVVFVAAVAATDLLWSPRLAVTASGVVVRSPTRSGRYPWTAIDAIRVDRRRRLGITQASLEIDLGDELIVLSQRALGADPRNVLEIINAARGGPRR
jgi:PH (Pleckstrin Homology) domain-containing protein